MNIFVTGPCPHQCALVLDDKRVVKMVLESAQLLSTAIHCCGGQGPYRPTHVMHPCSLWARKTNGNYNWLLNHFLALFEEYTYRYGRMHKSSLLYPLFQGGVVYLPNGGQTSFINATPHKEMPIFSAYRKTLQEKWRSDIRPPKWTRRERPF